MKKKIQNELLFLYGYSLNEIFYQSLIDSNQLFTKPFYRDYIMDNCVSTDKLSKHSENFHEFVKNVPYNNFIAFLVISQ